MSYTLNAGDTVRIVRDDYSADSPFVGLEGTLVKHGGAPGEWAVEIEPNEATMQEFAYAQETEARHPDLALQQILVTGSAAMPNTVYFYEDELELVQAVAA